MKEMAKFVSDCLDKRAQSISALATNSYLKMLKKCSNLCTQLAYFKSLKFLGF